MIGIRSNDWAAISGDLEPRMRDTGTGVDVNDHNFRRFSTIFGEKNWRFSQKPTLRSKFCII
jgi:hypothetical protein